MPSNVLKLIGLVCTLLLTTPHLCCKSERSRGELLRGRFNRTGSGQKNVDCTHTHTHVHTRTHKQQIWMLKMFWTNRNACFGLCSYCFYIRWHNSEVGFCLKVTLFNDPRTFFDPRAASPSRAVIGCCATWVSQRSSLYGESLSKAGAAGLFSQNPDRTLCSPVRARKHAAEPFVAQRRLKASAPPPPHTYTHSHVHVIPAYTPVHTEAKPTESPLMSALKSMTGFFSRSQEVVTACSGNYSIIVALCASTNANVWLSEHAVGELA